MTASPAQLCFVVLLLQCHDLSPTSKTAVLILVCPAQIKTSCSKMIKLINKGFLVYLFGSFSVFQDNSQSLLSYIVAYYLRHFDEVCFGSCLFESLFCFSLICLEILPELSFHLLSCQRIPWLILYQIIYFPFPHLRQRQISLLLWLSLIILFLSFTLHLPLSLRFGLASFKPAACSLAQHPKER